MEKKEKKSENLKKSEENEKCGTSRTSTVSVFRSIRKNRLHIPDRKIQEGEKLQENRSFKAQDDWSLKTLNFRPERLDFQKFNSQEATHFERQRQQLEEQKVEEQEKEERREQKRKEERKEQKQKEELRREEKEKEEQRKEEQRKEQQQKEQQKKEQQDYQNQLNNYQTDFESKRDFFYEEENSFDSFCEKPNIDDSFFEKPELVYSYQSLCQQSNPEHERLNFKHSLQEKANPGVSSTRKLKLEDFRESTSSNCNFSKNLNTEIEIVKCREYVDSSSEDENVKCREKFHPYSEGSRIENLDLEDVETSLIKRNVVYRKNQSENKNDSGSKKIFENELDLKKREPNFEDLDSDSEADAGTSSTVVKNVTSGKNLRSRKNIVSGGNAKSRGNYGEENCKQTDSGGGKRKRNSRNDARKSTRKNESSGKRKNAKVTAEESRPELEPPQEYVCEHCRNSFTNKTQLIDHLMQCSPILQKYRSQSEKQDNKQRRRRLNSYPCMLCDFETKRKKLLDAHTQEVHPELIPSTKSSIDKEEIDQAKLEVDGKIYYHCSECGKNLYSPYTFLWHKRIHTGERPYTCHLCGKQFRVNQGLARHLRETHAGIKKFECDICGRMFTTKRNVDDHRRTHTGERPYVCNVCGKAFKQKASLFVHNRTHTDLFPFRCSYCNQGFRAKTHLMVHVTVHTGEKPFACDICGRQFRIKFELKRHRLVHFDEKPWGCSDCGQTFRQKRYLVKHQKSNHKVHYEGEKN